MIFEIGRVCMKIAGRDANKYCVVIDTIDATYVEIDGQTRRRKVNINHLEPLDQVLKIKKGATAKEVADALTKAGFETVEKKKSSKQASQRPKKQKVKREKVEKTQPKTVEKKPSPKKVDTTKKADSVKEKKTEAPKKVTEN